MKVKQFNKTSAAMIAGAVVTILSSVIVLGAETQSTVQTLLTGLLVYLVPNKTE